MAARADRATPTRRPWALAAAVLVLASVVSLGGSSADALPASKRENYDRRRASHILIKSL